MAEPLMPAWVDRARPLFAAAVVAVPAYLVALVYYAGSPRTTDVGYRPEQPVAYSHALHAGQLGIDCRYCHNTVETAAFAAIPPTATCMNCHERIAPESEKIVPLRRSMATGEAIRWVKVHDLPEYVYFDHRAHVARGVGCVTCHGRVDAMEVVEQVETLSMGWCLDCHRDPDARLRPLEAVADMTWTALDDPEELGRRLRLQYDIHPRTDCSTCHR